MRRRALTTHGSRRTSHDGDRTAARFAVSGPWPPGTEPHVAVAASAAEVKTPNRRRKQQSRGGPKYRRMTLEAARPGWGSVEDSLWIDHVYARLATRDRRARTNGQVEEVRRPPRARSRRSTTFSMLQMEVEVLVEVERRPHNVGIKIRMTRRSVTGSGNGAER